jgi:ABC-type sugar transport system permease subunit
MSARRSRWRLPCRRQTLEAYLCLLPSLLFLVTFTHWPIFRSIWLSFFRWNLAHPDPTFAGVENYARLATDPTFRQVLWNTGWYAAGTVVPSIALGLFLAILLNQRIRGVSVLRPAFFYPTLIPTAAAAMIWVVLFTPGYGLVNYYLRALGGRGVEWLNDGSWAMWALIIVGVWKHVGQYMLIFLAGLQAIPTELYEAAITEGATWRQSLTRITLPLLGPMTFFVGIIAVIDSFQSVDQVYIMTKGGPYDSTNVLLYYIYQHAFQYADFGYGSTLSTFLLLLLLLFTVVYIRALSWRVTYQ